MIKISYFNYWCDPSNDNYFTKFIETNIGKVVVVKNNENPDILICSCFGDIYNVKKIKAKCKLFYYGENLDRYPPYNNEQLLQNTFDLIVGFKNTNLSKKQIRFPLWLMYYNYYKYDVSDNILTYIQSKYNKNIIKHKNLFCTIIAKHDRGGQRTILFNELSKYGIVKSPSLFNNNTEPIGNTSKDKINYISNSIYNICPENSKFEGYFTEKIFHALEAGTIPIYWAIDYPEPDILNKNKYCFCDIYNYENLKNKIINMINNPDEYINGDLFTENANIHIQNFYSTLADNISLLLNKN
jgi:hypothetical protein